MAGDFSSCKMLIMLQVLICLIVMVIAANAKIKGTFKCTTPPRRHTGIERGQGKSITCPTITLPTVKDGSFDCAPNSDVPKGHTCNLTCEDELYPAYSRQAVCVTGMSNQGAVWSNGSFVCQRLECNKWNEWNGSEYKFTSTNQSWAESRQLCEGRDSHLVTIENKEENEFVHKIVRHCNQDLWALIGLTEKNTEGMWEWSDGTVSTYRNWGEGQPNLGDAENCVIMSGVHGEWHDSLCSYHSDAICEKTTFLHRVQSQNTETGVEDNQMEER